jgi:hypothetical protein
VKIKLKEIKLKKLEMIEGKRKKKENLEKGGINQIINLEKKEIRKILDRIKFKG